MKKNFKKLLAIGISAAMTVGLLSACGGSDSSSSGTQTQTADSGAAADTSGDAEDESGAEESDAEDDAGESTVVGDFEADPSLEGQSIVFLNSKGEIQEALETMAEDYEDETGVHVDIQACGTGEVPYTKITTAYQSKNAPTMAMLDTTDVVALAETYAMDLSNEKWIADAEGFTTAVNGKVYSFPFCIEGRGLIYNKEAIEDTLGEEWDPSSVNSLDSLKELLSKLVENGMETPVVISHEDWSLGAHQFGYIYDTYDGTTAGSEQIIYDLETGKVNVADYDRFNEFMDTFDVLLENNFNRDDPNGSQYDQDALAIADGDAAFWANGVWAWPDIESAGASEDDDYGFLPFVLGNDTSDFANTSMQASATKQVIIDNVLATAEQQAAAKQFINWMVYSETGQEDMVEECAIIPGTTNNKLEANNPLGRDIQAKMASGNTYSSSFIAPSDHWEKVGASMQKYLAKEIDRAGLAQEVTDYWTAQTPTEPSSSSSSESKEDVAADESAASSASADSASADSAESEGAEAASTEAASTEAAN